MTGELDKPQRVGGLSASIVERGTGRRIRMKYDRSQLDSIASTWGAGALVEVSGQLRKSASGRTRSIDARSIRQLGAPMRFEDIIGLLEDDPTFDPKAYLDDVRGA